MIEPDDLILVANTIAIDLRANTLTIDATLPDLVDPAQDTILGDSWAVMDIGTRGRLLGLECETRDDEPSLTVTIADPEPSDLAVMRSVRIPVTMAIDHRNARMTVTFTRNGENYDLAWPSGNQCWRRQTPGPDGQFAITCSVLV